MRIVRVIVVLLLAAGLFEAGRYVYLQHFYVRNFHVVDEGKLYRCGQLTPTTLGKVIDDHGIKTVVSFRPREALDSDVWEEDFCAKRGVRHVRVKPRAWHAAGDGVGPPEAVLTVADFLAVVTDPANQPALVHCVRGAHRTGTQCAFYRMEVQGWSPEDTIAEMKALGYDKLDNEADVRDFIRDYKPRQKPTSSGLANRSE